MLCHTAILLLCSVLGLSGALAASSDEYLEQLKDKDPEVRANAAYELSCS
jgi:HEAT repeat protein